MLSFDIRSLAERAAAVDDTLSPDDPVWEDGDPKPSWPLRVKGRLSAAGPGRAPHPLTKFTEKDIGAFTWSPDGKRLAITRGTVQADIVMIRGIR